MSSPASVSTAATELGAVTSGSPPQHRDRQKPQDLTLGLGQRTFTFTTEFHEALSKTLLAPDTPKTESAKTTESLAVPQEGTFRRGATNLPSRNTILKVKSAPTDGSPLGGVLSAPQFTEDELTKMERRLNTVFNEKVAQLGAKHSETIDAGFNMALYLSGVGRVEDALKLHLEIYSLREKILGAKDIRTLISAHCIAEIYLSLDNAPEASIYAGCAAQGRKLLLGATHHDTVESMALQARILFRGNRSVEAEKLARDAYEARKKESAASPEDEDRKNAELLSLNLLALIHKNLDNRDAEMEFKLVIEERTKLHGEKHEKTYKAMGELAMYWYLVKRNRRGMEKNALDAAFGLKNVKGLKDPATLTAFHNCGLVMCGQKKFDKAEAHFRRAWVGRKEVFGEDANETISSLIWLNTSCLKMGKKDASEELSEALYKIHFEKYGAQDIGTLNAALKYGMVLCANEKHELAIPFLQSTIIHLEGTKGHSHKETLDVKYALGEAYVKTEENINEAVELLSLVFEMRRKILGPQNGVVVQSNAMLKLALQIQETKIANGEIERVQKVKKVASQGKTNTIERVTQAPPKPTQRVKTNETNDYVLKAHQTEADLEKLFDENPKKKREHHPCCSVM